jgi:hypothetical protein
MGFSLYYRTPTSPDAGVKIREIRIVYEMINYETEDTCQGAIDDL